MLRKFIVCFVGSVLVFSSACQMATAGFGGKDKKPYNVTHKLNIEMNGNGVPQVTASDKLFVNATNQGAGPGAVQANHTYTVEAVGLSETDTISTMANTSNAEANVKFDIAGVVAGAGITGEWSCFGYADANPVYRGVAEAKSSARLDYRRQAIGANGRVWYGPWSFQTISGGAKHIVTGKDPWDFQIFDRANNIVKKGTILDIESEVSNGELLWENNQFNFAATDGTFVYNVDSPYLSEDQLGFLSLKVEGGKVISTTATGIFGSTALPSLGTDVSIDNPVSFALTNMRDFTYSFASDATLSGEDLIYQFGFGGGGESYDEVVPEPAFLQMGVLSLAGGLGLLRGRRTAKPALQQ
jgi:hypothetical protein